MKPHLIIQATYDIIEWALFYNEQKIGSAFVKKTEANALLAQTLSDFLKTQTLSWQQLSYIGVNAGPGPFTSLRTLIATINGISFATEIPLISLDGIKSFFIDKNQNTESITVLLLNAFAGDCYYGIQTNQELSISCDTFESVIEKLNQNYLDKQLIFYGNGISLCKELLTTSLKASYMLHETTETTSLDLLEKEAARLWRKQEEVSHQIKPLYLKTMNYKPYL